MIKILEKDGNITTTDHTDILNILTVQSEFMFAGFFFQHLLIFLQIQFSSRSKATISESLSIADLSVISVFSNSSTEI